MSPHALFTSSVVEESTSEQGQTSGSIQGQELQSTIRPLTSRRSTEPSTPKSILAAHPRNRSPYARGHFRALSTSNSSPAPPMTRAHTSPLSDSFNHLYITPARPSSPLFCSPRRSSPLRRPLEDAFSSFSSSLDITQTISENSELDLTPRSIDELAPPLTPNSPYNATFPRSRRRPSSPLHHLLPSPMQKTSHLHTSTSSPALGAAAASPSGRQMPPTLPSSPRYNEAYPPSFYSQSSSSVPSTPTSFRSRSPSISSLETIPDTPDAEAAATEADTMARLKAAADREDLKKKGSERGVSTTGGRDKRKRWSVCGAERRGDLDLETIWED